MSAEHCLSRLSSRCAQCLRSKRGAFCPISKGNRALPFRGRARLQPGYRESLDIGPPSRLPTSNAPPRVAELQAPLHRTIARHVGHEIPDACSSACFSAAGLGHGCALRATSRETAASVLSTPRMALDSEPSLPAGLRSVIGIVNSGFVREELLRRSGCPSGPGSRSLAAPREGQVAVATGSGRCHPARMQMNARGCVLHSS